MKLRKNGKMRMKSFLCALLTIALLASSISAGALAVSAAPLTLDIGVNPESVTATLKENGMLSITGAGEIRDFTEQTAPFQDWDIRSVEFGAAITAIGDYTFYNCKGLDGGLTLPKGIVRIGDCAFSGKTAEKAPKPGFVENLFTDALVTSVKSEPDKEDSPVTSEPPSVDPAESAAEEDGAGDVVLSEEKTTDASGPEEDEPTDSSDSEESAAPVESGEEQPSAAEDGPEKKEAYDVTKITEQEVGKEIFFPLKKEAGVFVCTEENKTFIAAMEEAGYQKADSVVAVTLNSGEGSAENGDVVKKLPVLGGNLVLPALLPEFSAPKEEELFSYEFGGWTEQNDKANVVRKPGSRFPVGEKSELYFIANWTKIVKLSIEARRVKDTVTYSVPEITGYDVLSYQWQTRKGQGEWTAIENATERQYSRKLQAGDGDRAFRCTITVKKQQNALIQLFTAAQEEELSLSEIQSGLTELSETFAVRKADGVQTVEKTISLPVSEAGSTYSITGAKLPGGVKFVGASEETELSADGKTFALTIAPTGGNWQETEMQAELATDAEEHLVQTGDDPVTVDAGTAELDLTLQYNGDYEEFTGGTVNLTLEEVSGEEEKNLVTVALRLDDMTDVEQTAFTTSGRSFEISSGNSAVVSQKGGLTAGFVTEYYPAAAGTEKIRLSLYRESGEAASFPEGTELVVADLSGDTWGYYSYAAGGKSEIRLADGSYPGPTEPNVDTLEQLLFVFDFSKVGTPLATGSYYLTLTHALQEGAEETEKASFTVHAESGAASLSAQKTDDSTETLWGVQLTCPSGYWMQATLLNSGETETVKFPSAMTLTGAQAIARNEDGSIQFVPQGEKVTFDFSKVAAGEFVPGTYQVQFAMGPRPGLQNGGTTSLTVTMAEKLSFTYAEQAAEEKPAVRSLSVSADKRLLDVSEEDAKLELSIQYENELDGDTLQVEVLKKMGTNPGDKSYVEQRVISGYTGALTDAVTITVPKGMSSGTFRALVSIVAEDGTTVVAQEPYNFIIK